MEVNALLGLAGSTDRGAAMKKSAKEMEAQFVFEMLKEMRKSNDGSYFGGGPGSDTFASMFDMEVAHKISERGIGLQDFILKGMQKYEQKSQEAKAKAQALKDAKNGIVPEPSPPPNYTNLVKESPPISLGNTAKLNDFNPYANSGLKFSTTPADKSLEKLSRR